MSFFLSFSLSEFLVWFSICSCSKGDITFLTLICSACPHSCITTIRVFQAKVWRIHLFVHFWSLLLLLFLPKAVIFEPYGFKNPMHVLGDPFPIPSTNCELDSEYFLPSQRKKVYLLFIVYIMMETMTQMLILFIFSVIFTLYKSCFKINHFKGLSTFTRASLVAQWYRNHLLMQETWVQSLGQEDPLE